MCKALLYSINDHHFTQKSSFFHSSGYYILVILDGLNRFDKNVSHKVRLIYLNYVFMKNSRKPSKNPVMNSSDAITDPTQIDITRHDKPWTGKH